MYSIVINTIIYSIHEKYHRTSKTYSISLSKNASVTHVHIRYVKRWTDCSTIILASQLHKNMGTCRTAERPYSLFPILCNNSSTV